MIKEEASLKSVLLKTSLIFVFSYICFLFLWMGVKGYYGTLTTTVSSHGITWVKDISLDGLSRNGNVLRVDFILRKFGVKRALKIGIDVEINSYTYNAPLTFAIMASFYPFLRRKRVYAEVFLFLILVHILYVFSLEGKELTAVMTGSGFEKRNEVSMFIWDFLWQFTDNMILRFEPFLIGAYLYFFMLRGGKAMS